MERLRKLKKKLARPGDLKCGWCFFGDKFGPTPSHLLSTGIGYPHVAWRNLGLFRCKHTGVEELIVNPFIFSGADSSFIHAGLLRILHRNVCSRRLHAHDAFRRFCRAYFPDGCSFFCVLVPRQNHAEDQAQHGCCLVIVNQDQSSPMEPGGLELFFK